MSSPKASLWKIRQAQHRHIAVAPEASTGGFHIPLPSTRLALAVLAVIAVGVAVFVWQAWPRNPANGSAEAGFLRDMYTHHSQAVAMGMIIQDRTEDPELKALATDISLTQSTQMGTMLGYLELWDIPLGSSEPAMTWMGHPTQGPMPGMATAEDVARLEALPVGKAETLFLQLMIRHHQGGVEMATAYLERGDQDEVAFMADRIVQLQDSEIEVMNDMLEQREQAPVTDPLPETHDEGH